MKPAAQAYTPIPEWNWTFQVSVHRGEGLASIPTAPGAFRLVWVEEGRAQWSADGRVYEILGPTLVSLGSRDEVVVLADHAILRSAVFHPGALNDAFATHDVYDLEAFRGTTKSDQYYLIPFLRPAGGPLATVRLPLTMAARIRQLFDRMDQELTERRDGLWPCRTRSLLLEALILARDLVPPEEEPDLVDRVLLHLQGHYAEPVRLPDLSKRFATNRTTLSARFREKTGNTVTDYLRNLRLKVAEVLLRDTTLPVIEVMERVGFTDPSQFGRLFRRHTGHSPTEYRQEHSWLVQRT